MLLVAILSTGSFQRRKEIQDYGGQKEKKKQEQDRNAVFLHKHSIETAQLNGCHSSDSLDSKKLCLFVYSIYWYKDSSLRDTIYYDMWSRVASVQNFKQASEAEAAWRAGALLSSLGAAMPARRL